MASIRIPLNSRKYPGMFALIDEEDYPLVSQYRWYPIKDTHTFYAVADEHGTRKFMHRIVMHAKHGDIPDHINRNGLDNQKVNLRLVTKSQNGHNQAATGVGSSGFIGVSFYARHKQWCARITHEGRRLFLGLFRTPEEAARAYDAKARDLYEVTHLNFPDTRD